MYKSSSRVSSYDYYQKKSEFNVWKHSSFLENTRKSLFTKLLYYV
jgi:hypothetical protein